MDVLIRPYPKAVSGEIKEYRYDLQGKEFYVSFVQSESDCGESIICSPMEVKKIVIDGKNEKVIKTGTELRFTTAAGKHDVEVTFK